jgi:ectoine hydroxylase-related dioxygenase (phytanoyl-CoA dioxygenase family)
MNDDLLERYRRDGYAMMEALITPKEVSDLRDEATRLCLEKGKALVGASGNVSPDNALAAYLAIHFPHKLSGRFRDALAHLRIVDALKMLIGPNVKCMQSMLFIKHAGKPGQAWHQDEDFIPTRDRSLTAAWIALDDATIDNGCLWAIPGSHRPGILWPLRRHSNPEYDSIPESFDFPYDDRDARPIEVAAGSVVFFNGYLLHKSLRNQRRIGFRRALVNHYMSAESLLPWWRPGGPSPPTHDLRDVVLVAGSDPYASRGYEDVNRPYVRAEVAG